MQNLFKTKNKKNEEGIFSAINEERDCSIPY